jgi:predicted DsbA family dithiol-disulfide isomerase
VRLRKLREELGHQLKIEWRSFPLRPIADPTVRFHGSYREAAWKRIQALTAAEGIHYELWSKDEYPAWSLPSLEGAKCAALQSEECFERLHLRLYEAFFTRGINIGQPENVARIAEEAGCEMDQYRIDLESGRARALVLRDFELATRQHGVRAIPTIIIMNNGEPRERSLVGLQPIETYRSALQAREPPRY